MKTLKTFITLIGVFILLFPSENISGNKDNYAGPYSQQQDLKSKQTTSKSKQVTSKPKQVTSKPKQVTSKPVPVSSKTDQTKKVKDVGTVTIGTQIWAVANLNVTTFRNGDTIPEAKTNEEWKTAGEAKKPAWCYYNNDPANGQKYGKLYNWYAVNDPRGLAPVGWTLSSDADWTKLTYSLGGEQVAGSKMKSTSGWNDNNNGTNETGFTGLPGGYRVENGTFQNIGSNAIWWSSSESKSTSAFDHYLVLSASLGRSSSPKQRGSSVRCIRK